MVGVQSFSFHRPATLPLQDSLVFSMILLKLEYTHTHTHTHTHIYIYIYIYIYICVCVCVCVIHRQILSMYHNSSLCLDTQDASSWDLNFTQTAADPTQAREFNFCFFLHFTLSDTEVISSLEELCITRVPTVSYFANIHKHS